MRPRRLPLVLLVVVLVFVLPLIVEREPPRVYVGASPLNIGPDGTSSLAEILAELGYNVTIATSWSTNLVHLTPCLVVILSPEVPYTDSEIEVVAKLVSSGANLLVADEGTHSNKLLEYLKLPLRISGKPVLVAGNHTFTAKTEIAGQELGVVYAYSSGIDIVDRGSHTKVIAEVGDTILAVKYEDGEFKAIIIGDGTILTNALISPRNVLNPNYLLLLGIVRDLCTSGLVVLDGSKYRTVPQPTQGVGVPISAYAEPLGRILGAVLTSLIVVHLATYRYRSASTPRGSRRRGLPGAYEALALLCRDEELSAIVHDDCELLTKTHSASRVLRRIAARAREDRDVARKILKALLRV